MSNAKNPLLDFIPNDAPALAIGQWIPSGYFRKDGTFCPTVELINSNPQAHTVSGKCARAIFDDLDKFLEAVRAACTPENQKRVKDKQAARQAAKAAKENGTANVKETAKVGKSNPLAGFNFGN